MNSITPIEIAADLEEVRQQFESWRSTRAPRSRMPEAMWASAVKLARQYGLYRTAKALRLDYVRLKSLVGGGDTTDKTQAPKFVELVAAPSQAVQCIVELENGRGKKMRIHLPASAVRDLIALGRRCWSAKA